MMNRRDFLRATAVGAGMGFVRQLSSVATDRGFIE